MNYEYLNNKLLQEYTLIHHSKKEKIYLLPDKKVLKITKNLKDCRREYLVLRYAYRCPLFPKVYEYRSGYLIRDHVDGICIIDYLKKNTFDKELALSLINIYDTFIKLKFTRLDTGVSHIFITKDKQIRLIGLKSSCWYNENYPKHMLNGLHRLKVSKRFFRILKDERPELYDIWKK
ncbi:hypothetical protein SH2C18_20740 [Clostridium sediminicola]|uniref:serine/threonine protein kinase n=1 Tax=Clostridium sediminicola TaxID=3114879 RepID=UPI0031F216E5